MQSHHSFNVDDAVQYGVECAVLLYNIRYWLDKNKANNHGIHDGRVWTYNSREAFAELFPYLSESQVRRRLEKLIDAGILRTGNYNKNKYDQTLWYTIDEPAYSISQDNQTELSKLSNGNDKSDRPIPDINTDNKPNSSNLSDSVQSGLTALKDDPGRMSALQDLANQKKTSLDDLFITVRSHIVTNPDKYTSLFQSREPIDAVSKVVNSFLKRMTATIQRPKGEAHLSPEEQRKLKEMHV